MSSSKRRKVAAGGTAAACLPSTSKTSERNSQRSLNILNLPNEVIENILGRINFNEVSKCRMVSRRFDIVSQSILNKAFYKLQMQMRQRFQEIKSKMPRRESARRKHPLARESDITETLHMRLTLLHMTFGKHIERRHCCFFPGEILDEIVRILEYIATTTPNLQRAYKVTDELFDITTMAMEYFKEKIEPTLPEINYFTDIGDFSNYASPVPTLGLGNNWSLTTSSASSPMQTLTPATPGSVTSSSHDGPEHSDEIRQLRKRINKTNREVKALKKELKMCKGKLNSQHKQVQECNTRQDKQDKQLDETNKKLNEIFQEFQKCKADLNQHHVKLSMVRCDDPMILRNLKQVPSPYASPFRENQGL